MKFKGKKTEVEEKKKSIEDELNKKDRKIEHELAVEEESTYRTNFGFFEEKWKPSSIRLPNDKGDIINLVQSESV